MNDARVARDDALARVHVANAVWMNGARYWLRIMGEQNAGREVTGEMIRLYIGARLNLQPKSPHAWGALIISAVKSGALVDTGRSTRMTAEKSHARRTPVWRFR